MLKKSILAILFLTASQIAYADMQVANSTMEKKPELNCAQILEEIRKLEMKLRLSGDEIDPDLSDLSMYYYDIFTKKNCPDFSDESSSEKTSMYGGEVNSEKGEAHEGGK